MQKIGANKRIESYCEKNGNTTCPFSHEKCIKLSRCDIGVCSFFHKKSDQIICPRLFEQFPFIQYLAMKILKAETIEVHKEVKVGNNYIDYILVNSSDNSDYLGVELQTLDTSGNYKWVFGEKTKPFCINWKTTKKTILSQLICKVRLFEKNKKKLVLVIQDTFFDYLKLKKTEYDSAKNIHILSCSYHDKHFGNPILHSYSFNDLIDSMIEDENIDLNAIVFSLCEKHKRNNNIV